MSNGNGDRVERHPRLKLPKPPGPPEGNGDRKRPKLRKLRLALVLVGLSLLAAVSWMFGIMMAVAQDLPSLETREQYKRAQNSVVYDVNGVKIATLTNNQGRILLKSNEIAPVMKEAVVAIEDARFYEHRGIDYQGIARALYQDVLAGSAEQGASTITQQFVKNALAAQDSRTILQKFREAAIAYHLERQWSKDKILTAYLNEIYFGEGATGIEAAARTYFGWNHPGCGEGEGAPTCASELLPWEAALLAGMISSPSAYSPRNFPEAALERRNLVLQRMRDEGYITDEEYAEYSNPEIHPLPKPRQIQPPAENSEAPYFTSWLRQQLVDRYGAGEAFGGGLHITSTLDLELQREIEAIAASRVGDIAPTTAIVVLDNDTAAVRAMYGGSDYQKSPFNLATNGHRQPGSAFKPFTLLAALEAGHSVDEVFTSEPKEIPFKVHFTNKRGKRKTAHEVFDVDNYEDSYLGSADLATATTFSDNSVYAELGLQVGPKAVAEMARKLGIETNLRTPNKYSIAGGPYAPYNPAMILGGLETGVTPLEMAHAYNTIAADGQRLSGTMASSGGGPVGIVKVEDAPPGQDGDLVPDTTGASGENEVIAKQVIDPGTAQTAKEVLRSVVESGTGENAATGEPTWGKTGTTDDNGDAWFCGATKEITACVWVGHADTVRPMLTEYGGGPVDGGTIPALIFADIVNAYTEIMASRKAGKKARDDADELPPPSGDESPAPAAPVTSEPAPEDVAPAPETEAAAPEGPASAPAAPSGAGGGGGGGGAPSGGGGGTAPSGGGVAPG